MLSACKAHGKIKWAVVSGRIVKPKRCQRCGAINRKCADGRSSLQAHHGDYQKPLDVIWLCPSCHRRITPVAEGEASGVAKLTIIKVQAITKLSELGWGPAKLACAFDVNATTVVRALTGKSWLIARKGAQKS